MTSNPSCAPYGTRIAVLPTDEQTARRFKNLSAEDCVGEDVAVSIQDNGKGKWSVTFHVCSAAGEQKVRDLVAFAGGRAGAPHFEQVSEQDWVRASLEGLRPVAAGRFVVHGAHDTGRVAANRIGIAIEAALAFGTGHHASTRGCLLALDRMCKASGKRRCFVHRHPQVRAISAPRRMSAQAVALRGSSLRAEHLRVTGTRVLDLGTGSGVLAIAAARALRARVLATDIDAAAVRVSRDNARRNRVGSLVEVVRADGVAVRPIRRRAPFTLVFANILLEPLQRLASPLAKIVAPGGRVVLSGLLSAQANAALSAYWPFALERRIDLDGWTTLVLRRGRARRSQLGQPSPGGEGRR